MVIQFYLINVCSISNMILLYDDFCINLIIDLRRAVLACEAEDHYRWPRTNNKANTESLLYYIFINYLLTWIFFLWFCFFLCASTSNNIYYEYHIFVLYWQSVEQTTVQSVVTCKKKSRDILESFIGLIGTHPIQYWQSNSVLVL